jgi:hypothetical protein
MVVVGALAGFAAQNAALRSIGRPPVPQGAIVMVEAGSEKYYFGDRINGYLLRQPGGDKHPLWSYIAAAALQAGLPQAKLPDVGEMFEHVAKTIGTPAFGIPRALTQQPAPITPRKALELFWPSVKALLSNTAGPGPEGTSVAQEHWWLVVALVARQFIIMAKDTLNPGISLSLIMESAIAMSKVDPQTVPQTA